MSGAPLRGLSEPFLDALEIQAASPGWWRDVLSHPDLFIAVRGGYLNVYHRGASVFLIELKGSRLVPTTHVKYLVRQRQTYVALADEDMFAVDPAKVLWQRYEGPTTLNDMVRSAAALAGPEKSGLHPLLMASPHVVDVEVSLSRQDVAADAPGPAEQTGEEIGHVDQTEGSAEKASVRQRQDRFDVAVLEKRGDSFWVVFHEAKHFTNGELRARDDRTPAVAEQMKRYRRTIAHHASALSRSYLEVCRALVRIDSLRSTIRAGEQTSFVPKLDPIVASMVTAGSAPRIDPEPRLVIFGFDAAQRDDVIWQRHLSRLESEFKLKVRAIGNTRGRATAAFR